MNSLIKSVKIRYEKVYFVSLSMDALGTMGNSPFSFLDMLKDLDFDENSCLFLVRRQIKISMRTT